MTARDDARDAARAAILRTLYGQPPDGGSAIPPDVLAECDEAAEAGLDALTPFLPALAVETAPAETVRALIDAGRLPDDKGEHIVNLDDDGWTLSHPLACRASGELFDCPIHHAVSADMANIDGSPLGGARGRYVVTLDPDNDYMPVYRENTDAQRAARRTRGRSSWRSQGTRRSPTPRGYSRDRNRGGVMAGDLRDEWQLALPFDTDNSEFTRGVEVGMVWERLRRVPGPIAVEIHATNAEMMLRLSEATGRRVGGTAAGMDWLSITFDVQGNTDG